MSRPSVYLESKCKALLGAIDFFLSDSQGKERKLTFLAQIDFWDWELEELIYSCDNFLERSEAWKASGNSIDQMLRAQGFMVKHSDLIHVNWWKRNYREEVVAPLELLNYVISRWNQLLDKCETLFPANLEEKKEQFHLNCVTSLDKFKKVKRTLAVEGKKV